MNFGEHMMIDGYRGNPEKLNDKDLVLKVLTDLPKELEMNTLADPVVYYAPEISSKDPGGWSGVVVIMESHISIHTFPKRRFVSADVYTCKNGLDQQKIADYFKNKFELENLEINFIKRGTRYPESDIT